MKTKRIVCLALVVLMLICCVSCAQIRNTHNDGMEDPVSSTETATTTLDGEVNVSSDNVVVPLETSVDDATEAENTGNAKTTAGIIIIVVAILGIAGGIVLKVIQKKKSLDFDDSEE